MVSDVEPHDCSNSLHWWTRSQRIRTFGEMPFEVALLEAEERPVYQRIAGEATRMQRLGMRKAAIARKFGVDAKTVGKAIRFLSRNS